MIVILYIILNHDHCTVPLSSPHFFALIAHLCDERESSTVRAYKVAAEKCSSNL